MREGYFRQLAASLFKVIFEDPLEKHGKNMKKYLYLPNFISFLRPFIKEGMSVLDIGCGHGEMLLELRRFFNLDLYGIDIEEETIQTLKKTLPQVQVADAHNLSYNDNKFDLTISFNTIHILDDPEKACLEMERITKRGGLIFIGYSDQDNYISRLQLKHWTRLNPINDNILQGYFCNSKLIEAKAYKFLNIFNLLRARISFRYKNMIIYTPIQFPIIFDYLSFLLSKRLKSEKYISHRFCLFRKKL